MGHLIPLFPSSRFARDEVREEIFKKGQSKRIWGELYKVNKVILMDVRISKSLYSMMLYLMRENLKEKKYILYLVNIELTLFILISCTLI